MTGQRQLDQVREIIRIKHYSIRTEQAYVQWIRRYILFHRKRHPSELGAQHLSAFLSDLAVRCHVAASTQNQALNAILFLYRDVLKQNLPWVEDVQRAKRPQHLPVVMTRQEVKQLLAHLEGTVWLMTSIVYGGGLRLMECLRLRVKDIDLERGELTIRDGKGQKDRRTMLPKALIDPRTHLSGRRPLNRSALRYRTQAPRESGSVPACCEERGTEVRHREARERSYTAALVRQRHAFEPGVLGTKPLA